MPRSRPPVPPLSPEDIALWREETAHDALLPGGAEIAPPLPDLIIPVPVVQSPVLPPLPAVSASAAVLPYLTHGVFEGIDPRTRERIRKGEMPPQSRLDLHGMTQDAAHGMLEAFIRQMHARHRRLLLVITGKGGGEGILRRAVPQWLNGSELRPLLLGFDYAPSKLGGEGALVVMVRKKRD